MILLIDNYDSFTYNLYQYLRELGVQVQVRRNDQLTAEEALAMNPAALVFSPGPGRPAEAGIGKNLILAAAQISLPVLGVCLGHQTLGEAFGSVVSPAHRLMHGKTSSLNHDGKTIFAGLPSPFTVMRYHSLALDEDSIPPVFEISARNDDDKEVMAMRHRQLPLEGVQFHPESIMTEHGKTLLQNFLTRYLE